MDKTQFFFENGRVKPANTDIDEIKAKLEDVKRWAGEITRCLKKLENDNGTKEVSL